VACVREQRGGGEAADPATDHDDAAHDEPPSTIETMRSTPANDPAM
jgi:hypothetical protein